MSTLDPDARLVRGPGDGRPERPRRTVPGSEWTWAAAARLWQHPRRTGWLGDARNRYGTRVTVARCATCRATVTICPALTREERIPANVSECGGPTCGTYDPHRDVGALFPPEPLVPTPRPSLLLRLVLRIWGTA